jgi:NitT/TauT family transport system permease protein
MLRTLPARAADSRRLLTRWDLLAILVVLGLLAFLGEASRGLLAPLTRVESTPLSLSPVYLPEYAARTTLRMLAGLALSLLFTFTYATWAAKSPRAGRLLVPMLDVLQSVPILGFLSATVVFFMSLAPGKVLGVELAAIFTIFTSQAWNMAFSFYQSLRTVPVELTEAARSFRLSAWARFWRLEVPFGMPGLVWNMMMSMSGGWFFITLSEAISVGHTRIMLPGMGAYIALAIDQKNLPAIGYAILTMLIVIMIYDQLLFRPLVTWSDRFRFDLEPGVRPPTSWALTMMRRSTLLRSAGRLFGRLWRILRRPFAALVPSTPGNFREITPDEARRADILSYTVIAVVTALAAYKAGTFLAQGFEFREVVTTFKLGLLTMIRVFVLIALASIIWVPIGVWVGLRPRAAALVQPVAQFFAAFPANLLFPIAVIAIVRLDLNPNIWLSPLMILGTQWYILFNVIAGASTMPAELRYAARNLGLKGWLWWTRFALPAVLPFYVTGALTASGGAWNAAIVAEIANWGTTELRAEGLGAYIADATTAGDFHQIVLGVGMMSLFVVMINHVFWRPIYRYAERKYRLS